MIYVATKCPPNADLCVCCCLCCWWCLGTLSRPSSTNKAYEEFGNQSQNGGFLRAQNTVMRPHTVGDIPRRLGTPSTSGARRPGTGYSTVSSLRPGTSSSSIVREEEYMQMQQQCRNMEQRLKMLETAIDEVVAHLPTYPLARSRTHAVTHSLTHSFTHLLLSC